MTGPALVVNADDAGFDAEVDAAILACARDGLVTSASVCVTGPTARDFVAAARAIGLGLGLHLNLSEGRPLEAAPSLRGPGGRFHAPKTEVWRRAATGLLDEDDLAREATAQLAALIALGAEPDHLDSHNHLHCYPAVLDALLAAAGGRRLHVRIPFEPECPTGVGPALAEPRLSAAAMRARIEHAGCYSLARFVGHVFSDRGTATAIGHLERRAAGGTEWMVHPGSRSGTSFTASPTRDREADLLHAASLLRRVETWGYRLARFGELA